MLKTKEGKNIYKYIFKDMTLGNLTKDTKKTCGRKMM